jgi:hypothetical protein
MNYYRGVDVALPTKPDCTRRPPPGWDAPLITHDDGEQKGYVYIYFKYAGSDRHQRYHSMFSELSDVIPVVFYFWEDLLSACMDSEPAVLLTDSIEAVRGICTWCDAGDRKTSYMLVGDLCDKSDLAGIPIERLDLSAVRVI